MIWHLSFCVFALFSHKFLRTNAFILTRWFKIAHTSLNLRATFANASISSLFKIDVRVYYSVKEVHTLEYLSRLGAKIQCLGYLNIALCHAESPLFLSRKNVGKKKLCLIWCFRIVITFGRARLYQILHISLFFTLSDFIYLIVCLVL